MSFEKEKSLDKEIGPKFLDKLKLIQDNAALVVTIHLYTEYWINRILKEKKKNPGEIVKNESSYSVKLDFVYNMGFITDQLFSNLKKLNKLRNKCAHQLDYDFVDMDCNYTLFSIPDDIKLDKIQNIHDRLVWIGIATFGVLHNHCMTNLNIGNE
ncbi:hypothetical protein BIV60_13875 [Bacillus sp. MUM 116]|uniref:hypothetical protein n=1 Tax=Bacillus sp. MUM 116 TaxID=1678002 RepID=UPI0008F57EC2|nr:hypothetical protein [Bacillus sp. MUM 116]OIK13578.1 hypothetical protein BIV60_13875 [Bacillus sp. MUM 116]